MGRACLGWVLPLWLEAPHCRSGDNPTGTGGAELYGAAGPGQVVPRLSGGLFSQPPDLSAASTWDSWPSFYIPWYELLGFFHSKLLPSKTSSLLRREELGRGGHVGNAVSWSCSLSAAAGAPGTPGPLLPPQFLVTPSGLVWPHLSSQPWHVAAHQPCRARDLQSDLH